MKPAGVWTKVATLFAATVMGLFALVSASHAQTANDFYQLVAQLQQSPSDVALRERIIRDALARSPTPAVPEEGRRFLARGSAAFETASTPADFLLAATEFARATNVAPWWADAYLNLGRSYERAEMPREAVTSYNLYLLAAPRAQDAEAIRTNTYRLEFLAEQAERAASTSSQVNAARAQRQAWAQAIVQRLQSDYGGRGVRGLVCNRCTDQMAAGNNWNTIILSQNDPMLRSLPATIFYPHYSLEGPDQDQVRVEGPYASLPVCGAPNGPSVTDVSWAMCPNFVGVTGATTRGAAIFSQTRDGSPRLFLLGNCDNRGTCTREDFTLARR